MKKTTKKGPMPENKSYAASGLKLKIKIEAARSPGKFLGSTQLNSQLKPVPGVTAPAVGTPENVVAQKISKVKGIF